MIKIELTGMTFRARHGCLEWEKTTDQTFTVDFCGYLESDEAASSDMLEDTLDYSAVYDVIAGQMAESSDLLEHVAGRIVRCLAEEFPRLARFSVSVAKMDPPVGGPAAMARITIEHTRGV